MVLSTALLLRMAGGDFALAGYVVLAGYALFGPIYAVHALGMSWLFSMISGDIALATTAGTIGRFGVIAAAATSVLLRPRFFIPFTPPVRATLLLGAFLVLHSIFFSTMPDVSVLKAVAWTVSVATLFAAWGGLSEGARALLERQVFSGLLIVLVLSLAVLLAGEGYYRGGGGFRGILGQPQAFGLTLSLLGAWLIGRLLGEEQPSWKRGGILSVVLILIILSKTRTAGLALVAGVPAAILITAAVSRLSMLQLVPAVVSSRLFLMFLVVSTGLFITGIAVTEVTQTFIQKQTKSVSILDAYEKSRGPMIGRMWSNIQTSPIRGIGFGIASVPSSMVVERDPLLGLPVGASVEKGVMPLAVLEELGIPGFLAVAAWLLIHLLRAARGGLVTTTVWLTAIFINMGESLLFSSGGMGMMVLLLICWASTARHGSQRQNDARY